MSKLPHILTAFIICAYMGLFVVLVKESAPRYVATELAPKATSPRVLPPTTTHTLAPHAMTQLVPRRVLRRELASRALASGASNVPAPDASVPRAGRAGHHNVGHQKERVLDITREPLARAPHSSLSTSLNEDLYKAPPGIFPLLLLLLTCFMVSSIGRCWRPNERFRDYRLPLRARKPS